MKTGVVSRCHLPLLLLGWFGCAQSSDQITSKDVKTVELVADEYEKWISERADWPNLARYGAANAQVRSPKSEEDRVVFMGNSITEGWLHFSPEFFEGKPYINRGI